MRALDVRARAPTHKCNRIGVIICFDKSSSSYSCSAYTLLDSRRPAFRLSSRSCSFYIQIQCADLSCKKPASERASGRTVRGLVMHILVREEACEKSNYTCRWKIGRLTQPFDGIKCTDAFRGRWIPCTHVVSCQVPCIV